MAGRTCMEMSTALSYVTERGMSIEAAARAAGVSRRGLTYAMDAAGVPRPGAQPSAAVVAAAVATVRAGAPEKGTALQFQVPLWLLKRALADPRGG